MITSDKLTIVVLASNEQKTFRETINRLCQLCSPKDIAEIIVFLKSEDCLAKKEYEKIVKEGYVPFPMRSYIQTIPGFDEMFYEAPKLVNSSHFLLIGADLEMDPDSIPDMLKIGKENPDAIVCASKWANGSVREGYNFIHMIAVRFVNFVARKIIGSTATELVATFQIYPTEIHRKMEFNDEKRAFYEFTLKPVLYGERYIEIPTHYVRRTEGRSNLHPIKYLRIGLIFIDTAIKLKREKKRNEKHKEQ